MHTRKMITVLMWATLAVACEKDAKPTQSEPDAGASVEASPDAAPAQEPQKEMEEPAKAPDADAQNLAIDSGTWVLVSMGDGGQATKPIEGTPVTLLFEGGKLVGAFGCNQATGTYELPEGVGGPFPTVKFSPIALTKKACTGEQGGALMAQENQIAQSLGGTQPLYRFEDGQLVLFSEGKDLFRFALEES